MKRGRDCLWNTSILDFQILQGKCSNTAKVRWKSLQGIYRKFPAEYHSERIVKIGVHLLKLWPKNKVAVFFGTLCNISSSSTSRSSLVCYNFNWFRQVLADNSSWLLAYYTLIQWFICNNYWHCAHLIKHWTVTQNVYAKCHIIIFKVFILTFFKL